ncbi:MAG: hypothetical protein JXB13_01515 [Phycisphaerae bacterium]|nr:hypothetical protein [Phycisphaerae bacterium]
MVLLLVVAAGRMVLRDGHPTAESAAAVKTRTTDPGQDANAADLAPLQSFAVLWQRDLQQPPIPPAPAPAVAEPAKPPPPLPRLLGTFLVDTRARAHLVGQAGKPRMVGPGDVLDAYVVMAIEPGRVQLKNADRVAWIEVTPPRGKPQGGP